MTTQQKQDRSLAIKELVGNGDLAENAPLLIEKAKSIAVFASKMINEGGMYTMIDNNKYINVEGWSSLGIILGVFPRIDSVERIEQKDGSLAYFATVSLYSKQGTLITTATALCSSNEKGRGRSDEYVIHSMAQTRATGRAYRQAFGWVMTYEGFSTTPAEEMSGVEISNNAKQNNRHPSGNVKGNHGGGRKEDISIEDVDFDSGEIKEKTPAEKAKEEMKNLVKPAPSK